MKLCVNVVEIEGLCRYWCVCVCECINMGPTEEVSENLLSYRLLCSACRSHSIKGVLIKFLDKGNPFLPTLPNINLLIFYF